MELALIERIRLGGGELGEGVAVGIGDDCAVLRVKAGEDVVVTTDFCLEGRHFRRDWQGAEEIGWGCLLRGLSDVAAMGGRPVAAFLSLGLPRGFDLGWVDGFLAGFRELGGRYGVGLAGGDTAEVVGETVVADVVVVGAVRRGRALLRTGAKVGDGVYVTGRLGGAAAELGRRMAGERVVGVRREPRVAMGLKLRVVATSCMDLSDGLSSDVRRLGVGVELQGVPVAEGATLEQALHGGEDYELLFTAGGRVPRGCFRVGTVVSGTGVTFEGEELSARGWEHFG